MGLDVMVNLVHFEEGEVSPTIFKNILGGELTLPYLLRHTFCYWSPQSDEDGDNMWGSSLGAFLGETFDDKEFEKDYEDERHIHKLSREQIMELGKQYSTFNQGDIVYALVTLEEYFNRSSRYGFSEVPYWGLIESYISKYSNSGSRWFIFVTGDQPVADLYPNRKHGEFVTSLDVLNWFNKARANSTGSESKGTESSIDSLHRFNSKDRAVSTVYISDDLGTSNSFSGLLKSEVDK